MSLKEAQAKLLEKAQDWEKDVKKFSAKENKISDKDGNLGYFTAKRGKSYDGELMVIGIAVNGWLWDKADGSPPSDEFIEKEMEKATKENDQPFFREYAFWNTIRRVCEGLENLDHESASAEWSPSKIVWSNLYKTAPANGGNPNDLLCEEQFDDCKEILIAEIEEFKPKRILFLAGAFWSGWFWTALESDDYLYWIKKNSDGWIDKNGWIDRIGYWNYKNEEKAKIVSTRYHPRASKEGMSAEKLAETIVESFNTNFD